MADAEAGIKITGDATEFAKALAKAQADLQKTGEEGKKAFSIMDIAAGNFIAHFAEKGVEFLFDALKEGMSEAIKFIEEGVAASAKLEEGVTKLNYSFALAGQYTEGAGDRFKEFADQQEHLTNVSKGLIVQNASVIESLTKLDENGLQRVTKAALDFSAATGTDFSTASTLLSKAAEGNVEVFKRYGVTLENTGDRARDFEKAISTLESRFGGSAEAATKTFSGSIARLKNSIEDIGEALGELITKSPGLNGLIQGFVKVFDNLKKAIDENHGSIKDFIENGVDTFIKGFQAAGVVAFSLLKVMEVLHTTFGFLKFIITDLIALLILPFEGFVKLFGLIGEVTGQTNNAVTQFGETLEGLRKAIHGNAVETAKTTAANVDNYDRLGDALLGLSNKTSEILKKSVDEAREAGEQEKEAHLEKTNTKSQISLDAQAKDEQDLKDHLERTYALSEDVLGEEAALQEASEIDKLISEKKYFEAKEKLRKLDDKNEKESIFAVQKYEDLSQKEKLSNLKGTLGSIATLQQSSSSELFAIGKASALAIATIDGIEAVQKALASAPPPFNFALAALVGVAQAQNLSKIAGASPPTGAAEGALVAGGQYGVDTEPFMLSKGEIVAPAKNFDEVINGVASQRGLVPKDEDKTNELLQQLLDKPANMNFNFSVDYNNLQDDRYINELANQLRNAVQFRSARLA